MVSKRTSTTYPQRRGTDASGSVPGRRALCACDFSVRGGGGGESSIRCSTEPSLTRLGFDSCSAFILLKRGARGTLSGVRSAAAGGGVLWNSGGGTGPLCVSLHACRRGNAMVRLPPGQRRDRGLAGRLLRGGGAGRRAVSLGVSRSTLTRRAATELRKVRGLCVCVCVCVLRRVVHPLCVSHAVFLLPPRHTKTLFGT